MTVSITNWFTAGGQLAQMRDVCLAFQRGDQPEKTEHLTVDKIKELHEQLVAIVDFGVASLERGAHEFKHREFDTYSYAKSFARTLGYHLLYRPDTPPEVKTAMEEWCERERSLPLLIPFA